ncbi:hypothetical protein ACVWWG_000603 [Bradyrhizobium sp. LB7.2]
MNKARIAAASSPAGLPLRLLFAAAAILLALLSLPQAGHAQGIVRGAQEGSYEGNRIAGPVGGAVGGVVGAGVGGAVGRGRGCVRHSPSRPPTLPRLLRRVQPLPLLSVAAGDSEARAPRNDGQGQFFNRYPVRKIHQIATRQIIRNAVVMPTLTDTLTSAIS